MTIEQMTPEEEVRLRLAAGISPSTPTEYMLRHIPLWVKMSILRRNLGGGGTTESVTTYDFTTNTYRKNGGAVSLGDVSEFIRLSTATEWQDGQLVEVQNNIPRISGEGLLIEPLRTNRIPVMYAVGSATMVRGVNGVLGAPVYMVSGAINPENYFIYPLSPATNRSLKFIIANPIPLGGIVVNQSGGVLVTILSDGSYILGSYIPEGKVVEVKKVESGLLVSVGSVGGASSATQYRIYALDGIGKFTVDAFQLELGTTKSSSLIPLTDTASTRAPDILNIPLLTTQTITGDWDEGVTYSVAGGIATFTGHGYIRNITVETL